MAKEKGGELKKERGCKASTKTFFVHEEREDFFFHFSFSSPAFRGKKNRKKNVVASARPARSCLPSRSFSSAPPKRQLQKRCRPLWSSLPAPSGERRPRLRRRKVELAGAAAAPAPPRPFRLLRLLLLVITRWRRPSGLRPPPDSGPSRSLRPRAGAVGCARPPAAGRAEVRKRERDFFFVSSLHFDVDRFFLFPFFSFSPPTPSDLASSSSSSSSSCNPSSLAQTGSTAPTAPARSLELSPRRSRSQRRLRRRQRRQRRRQKQPLSQLLRLPPPLLARRLLFLLLLSPLPPSPGRSREEPRQRSPPLCSGAACPTKTRKPGARSPPPPPSKRTRPAPTGTTAATTTKTAPSWTMPLRSRRSSCSLPRRGPTRPRESPTALPTPSARPESSGLPRPASSSLPWRAEREEEGEAGSSPSTSARGTTCP